MRMLGHTANLFAVQFVHFALRSQTVLTRTEGSRRKASTEATRPVNSAAAPGAADFSSHLRLWSRGRTGKKKSAPVV